MGLIAADQKDGGSGDNSDDNGSSGIGEDSADLATDDGKSDDGRGHTQASNDRMVLSLALIDLLMSACFLYTQILYVWLPDGGYVEGDRTSHAICVSQAFLELTTQWLHMSWQLLFGFNFALRVCTPYLSTRLGALVLRRYVLLEVMYHMIAWTVSLSISIYLLLTGAFGRTYFGCWIKRGHLAQFPLFYIPQFTIFALIFIFYLVIFVTVKHLQTRSRLLRTWRISNQWSRDLKHRQIFTVRHILRQNAAIFKLSPHLLMYMIVWSPTMIISVVNIIVPDYSPLWLIMLKTSFCLAGFFDCIVFSVNNGYLPSLARVGQLCGSDPQGQHDTGNTGADEYVELWRTGHSLQSGGGDTDDTLDRDIEYEHFTEIPSEKQDDSGRRGIGRTSMRQ